MDDLQWVQRFFHVFFLNLIIFALFYIAFLRPVLENSSSSDQSYPSHTAIT
jgi:hypothetical protein